MPISEDNLAALSDFAAIADDYCRFIKSLKKERPERLYHHLESLLERLHAGILPVGKTKPKKAHPQFDQLRMSYEQWEKVAAWVGKAVADETSELVVWHEGLDADDDYSITRSGTLWDDLAEIYRDLKHGLSLWKEGTVDAKVEAAWQWRFGFENHWGMHLFRAMATVHEARYKLDAD